MVRVRFAPSPTGSLHVGNALTALANRAFADDRGGALLLRIDDTDAARGVEAGEEGILRDLEWLGIAFDEGPVRQSQRARRHAEAAERLLASGAATRDAEGAIRFHGERRATLVRAGGAATYHLASVVDDLELGITHVIRGADHRPNTPLHEALARALGGRPPAYRHHGLLVTADGRKLSKRHAGGSVADLRALGIPPEALVAYLRGLGLPRGDVVFDLARLRRHAVEALAALGDDELAGRLGTTRELAAVARGARDLEEARRLVAAVARPPAPAAAAPELRPTLERFRELRERSGTTLDPAAAKEILREVKAVGGNLRGLRVALTGAERGPELWRVLAALPREEALRRVDAAL